MKKSTPEQVAVAEFALGILQYFQDGNALELHECGVIHELRQAVKDGGLDPDGEDEEEREVELLVVIDKRDAEEEARREEIVSGVVGLEPDSMDEFGEGIDLLYHCDTVEEAEALARQVEDADLGFVQSVTVNEVT